MVYKAEWEKARRERECPIDWKEKIQTIGQIYEKTYPQMVAWLKKRNDPVVAVELLGISANKVGHDRFFALALQDFLEKKGDKVGENNLP